MNERIKKLRKSLDLTQREFAHRIGTTANVLTNYETGRRNPSSSVINNVCKEFNVNEEWLRTGNGEMFNKENLFSLDEFLKRQEATDLEIEIIKLLFSFDKNTREELISKLKKIFQSENINNEFATTIEPTLQNKNDNIPLYYKSADKMTDEEIEEEVADYRRQLILEKRQTEESSALPNIKNA